MLLDILAQAGAPQYLQQGVAIMIDARRMILVFFFLLVAEQVPGLNGRELHAIKTGFESSNVILIALNGAEFIGQSSFIQP